MPLPIAECRLPIVCSQFGFRISDFGFIICPLALLAGDERFVKGVLPSTNNTKLATPARRRCAIAAAKAAKSNQNHQSHNAPMGSVSGEKKGDMGKRLKLEG